MLYFEGERGHHFRVLRAVKNRFGPTDEIGVFEMTGKGLAEVANPSALFLGDRNSTSPGTAVFAGLEGTRPLLVEIQALVAAAGYGTPRRAVVGWDTGRLAMILAVLDARGGLGISASRCLSERRRRPESRRTGGRSGGRRGAGFVLWRPAAAARHGVFRRNQPFGRCPAGAAGGAAPERSGKAGLYHRLSFRAGTKVEGVCAPAKADPGCGRASGHRGGREQRSPTAC